MSTELIDMEGKTWDKDDNSRINPRTLKQQVSLNRFFGGLTFGGRAMQITVGHECVLLTPKQAWELGNILTTAFNPAEIFPSE